MKWAYSVGGFLEVGGDITERKIKMKLFRRRRRKEKKAGVKAARGAAQLVV